MGCCHANSPPLLEEHEKLRDIDLKKESKDGKNLTMIEHFAYYEKNPEKNGKYMIKKRAIQKNVPILRSVSESKLFMRRKMSENTKETESDKSNEEKMPDIPHADSLEIIQ
jgi:hypothetical protein